MGKKILVVDDDTNSREIVKRILNKEGFEDIIFAVNGEECLSLAERDRPALIILDIMLPKMVGSQVGEELSNKPVTRSIPIIFLTGLLGREEGYEGNSETRKSVYISKQDLFSQLVPAVRKFLES